MHFPVAIAPWVRKHMESGASVAELRQALTDRMGYTPHVADAVLAAAQADLTHLQHPPLGTRPDVRRDECGYAVREVTTIDGATPLLMAELAAPQVLVFKSFLPRATIEAVNEQLAHQATRVDSYVDSDRASQDHLLPGTGASLQCLQAAASALNWPFARWGLPLVRDTHPGQEFNLHYDAFGTGAVDSAAFKAVHGDVSRIGTLLIYLQPAQAGGSTYFANLGLRVCLDPGDAVYFGYAKDNLAQSGLLHAGERVHRGVKRIMTLFCYDADLRRGG